LICPHGVTPKRNCSRCQNDWKRKWRENNREQHNEINRKYRENNRGKCREYARQHKQLPYVREYRRVYQKKYRAKNRKREIAHNWVARHGKLAGIYEFCGPTIEKLQTHHPDYNYPHIFVTCCQRCHSYADRSTKEIEMDSSLEEFIRS